MAGIRQATARVSAAKTRETVPQETLTTAFLQMKKELPAEWETCWQVECRNKVGGVLLKGKMFLILKRAKLFGFSDLDMGSESRS
jgi:hypothetical protein